MKTAKAILFFWAISCALPAPAQFAKPLFRVIAFYSAKHDPAHISFVEEANKWFAVTAAQEHFYYEATDDWNRLDTAVLSRYQLVLFLDARPDKAEQRKAFETYMQHGGAWMGFHFSAFALPGSAYPDNWPWYHNDFLGSGNYVSNTWRPTAAFLRTEQKEHPALKGLPAVFRSSPNEWYRWQNDLRKNPDIDILLSIDPRSFPLGTGPKPQEIWHNGYYPVVWSNRKYHMIYFNMGHNDIDYEHHTNRELSFTFQNPIQNRLILNALFWLGAREQHQPKRSVVQAGALK
ncbi:ThuA domain-containing protein [Niabella beijingensis]|uniref:ThuA domain-containing protein n=1 Tax=Niabella beijingensis TaxID=2872700 RepID=UPI001CBAFAAA|nr:ThuA domain-containing protein [Niabella beijingensis]MBZ4190405.1 ThuA domain-containing protein [Niabella beijingensis]